MGQQFHAVRESWRRVHGTRSLPQEEEKNPFWGTLLMTRQGPSWHEMQLRRQAQSCCHDGGPGPAPPSVPSLCRPARRSSNNNRPAQLVLRDELRTRLARPFGANKTEDRAILAHAADVRCRLLQLRHVPPS